jgi:hypothetical protein
MKEDDEEGKFTGFVLDLYSNRPKAVERNELPKRYCTICQSKLSIFKVNKLSSTLKGFWFFDAIEFSKVIH